MSKILLLGEYSGVHKNLKEGLKELGHEVIVASSGDGKKNITSDIDLSLNSTNKIMKFQELRNIIKGFQNFDVVQFINPYITHKLGVLLYEPIYQQNSKVFCLGAGDDVEFVKFALNGGMKKYSPLDEYVSMKETIEYTTLMDKFLHKKFMKNLDGVIPIMWEYAESYRKSQYSNKLKRTIPLPINTNKIEYQENRVKNKLVFYHASNRPLFKGSEIIIEAMKAFQNRYPNEVEMIFADFLPLDEYLEVIGKTNVVIDQCRSYSYGMNAAYCMAKGKIVLSGSETEALTELGISNSPVINIQPNVNQLILEFEKLLENKHLINEKSIASREYVEDVHDYIKITNSYLENWA